MTLSLLLGVHAHQPVGNFPEVIADAHIRCYRKFFEVLDGYPEFRFASHFSGWLLDEMAQRWPEDIERMRRMTQRGQIEWFGSGDCEPVLASIPHRDRMSQIETLSVRLDRMFGQRPQGAWLTERVWESAVAASLAQSGIRYVAVDDYHFLCAGADAEKLDSFHSTEEDGRRLDLFPISEAARYRLPFSPAADVVAWLEDQARQGCKASIYFDDIEKFGIWPETYEWVYEKGWLAQFIEGVLRSKLIRTETFADFHAREATRGVVYLPTASYIEMNEWTLPGPAAREYHQLLTDEKAAGRFEARKPFLRGGIWRNFFSRYPESNWMHKRMLENSERLNAMPAARGDAVLREHLHRAQANDAYWHGLFGGLYLPHLRRAIWNNLLALEAGLNALAPPPALERVDRDLDGCDEVFLRSKDLLAVLRVDGDAALVELSSYPLAHNFGDTLRRTDEAYHDKLDQSASGAHEGEGIASAHDRVAFRHAIAPSDAAADSRPRGLFIDSIGTAPLDNYRAKSDTAFVVDNGNGRLEKLYELGPSRLGVTYRWLKLTGELSVCINLAMPSCDGFLGRYRLEDGSVPGGFGAPLRLDGVRSLSLEDGVLGGALRLSASLPVRIEAQPHRSVSQSEAGFEKIMQAVEITVTWPLGAAGTLQLGIDVMSQLSA